MSAVAQAPYLRATVIGRHRGTDVVLPTDEPVSLLVPQLLALLDEPRELGRVHLATSLGVVLDSSRPLAEADVVDGVRLRLVTEHDLPPAPLVHDLVEVVEHSAARGRWTPSNRATTLALVGGLLVAAAVLTAFAVLPGFDGAPALAVGAGLWGLSAVASALRATALAWVGAALGVGTTAMVLLRSGADDATSVLLVVGLLTAALLAVAWCSRRLVAGALGVLTLLGLTAAGGSAWVLTDDLTRTAAVVATLAILALGLAPRLALGASGVFALDSRLADGHEVATVNAEDAVARAHWGLTGATLVAALVFGAAAFVLGRGSGIASWPAGLTVVVSLAFALRARHFPLALHRAGLWVGALSGPLGLVVAAEHRWPVAGPGLLLGLAATGAAVALAGVVRRTPLQQARGRRRANQLETGTILLSVPMVLGVFGVYQDLLGTFR